MNTKNIRSARDLRDRILVLEEAKIQQEYTIQDHWETLKENYRPKNLIRKGVGALIGEAKANPGLILSTAGLGLGFLIMKLLHVKSSGIVRKLAFAAWQVGVSRLLMKKESANGTYKFPGNIFSKKKKPALLAS